MDSFVLLAGFEFSMDTWLDAAGCCQYLAFSIAPRLNVMLTGVGLWLQGTRSSVLIFFWRDIFEPYMSPWVVRKLNGILCSQELPLQINEILYIHVQR